MTDVFITRDNAALAVRDLRYLADRPGRTETMDTEHAQARLYAQARLSARWLADRIEEALVPEPKQDLPAAREGAQTMTARVQVESTTTITLTLTAGDATQILADFDKSREPSLPGKALYSALVSASRRGQPDA